MRDHLSAMSKPGELQELVSSVVVDRSVQDCWEFYINNRQMALWASNVTAVECEYESLNAGVVRKNHIVINGKQGHTVERCTFLDPLKRIDISIVEETFGFAHMLVRYGFGVSFDIDDKSTLLTMRTWYVPKRIFSSVMTSRATQQQLRKLMVENLNGFKDFAELTAIV